MPHLHHIVFYYVFVVEQTIGRKIIAVIDGDNHDFELLIDEDLLWTGTYSICPANYLNKVWPVLIVP